jgi:hypothetical protein
MLFHLKPQATAYLENVWILVADHNLDKSNRPQIDIYVGRGILVQGKKARLWGTSSEHCALYQYQLSDAANIVMVGECGSATTRRVSRIPRAASIVTVSVFHRFPFPASSGG